MFLPDEVRHFEETERPDNHIYTDLIKLQEYLQQTDETIPTTVR